MNIHQMTVTTVGYRSVNDGLRCGASLLRLRPDGPDSFVYGWRGVDCPACLNRGGVTNLSSTSSEHVVERNIA